MVSNEKILSKIDLTMSFKDIEQPNIHDEGHNPESASKQEKKEEEVVATTLSKLSSRSVGKIHTLGKQPKKS